MRLKDKVAIITGGSRGIGYATADAFLREGATVIITASSKENADRAVARLQEAHPGSTVAGISPDLSDLASVRNEFLIATAKYGCVDILVNNAGVSERTPFLQYTEEDFDKVMDLNVKGVFNATRVAADCMVARGSGVILTDINCFGFGCGWGADDWKSVNREMEKAVTLVKGMINNQ